jgi:hypothetical protein
MPELLSALGRGAAHFVLLFGVATFTYGAAAWWGLRLLGMLNLVSLLAAGALPVVAYVGWSLATRGYDPGWVGATVAFGVPAMAVAGALWWFTVARPSAQ